jgi:hypothetical protein
MKEVVKMLGLAAKIETITQTPVDKSDIEILAQQFAAASKMQSICWMASVLALSVLVAFCVWIIYKQKR